MTTRLTRRSTTRSPRTSPPTVARRQTHPLHLGIPLLLLLLTAAALFLAGCAARGGGEGASSSGDQPSPDFRLASLDGEEISPQDYRDQVVVVDFWATWCGPCHQQADILESVYQEVQGDGVQFLAVNLGEDEETVRTFVEDNPFPYPVLLDPEDHLTYDLGIFALPTLMVVDTEGHVTYFETGILNKRGVLAELAKAGAEVG